MKPLRLMIASILSFMALDVRVVAILHIAILHVIT